MTKIINDAGLDALFRAARSHSVWTDKPVSDVTLQALYDLLRYGPTSANCSPARFVFLKSDAAKERLKPFLMEGNVEKVMTSPVTAIIGHDMKFYDKIPQLFPHNPEARDWFSADDDNTRTTAFRNGTLQGAYMMLAARAVGLDCGPMSGFDNAGVDAEFFADTSIKSNFICALGYGDESALFPRSPRLSFDEACSVL